MLQIMKMEQTNFPKCVKMLLPKLLTTLDISD